MTWNRMPGYGVGAGCKDCEERHRACQDTCERLNAKRAEYEAAKERARKNKDAQEYSIDTARKAKVRKMKRDRK